MKKIIVCFYAIFAISAHLYAHDFSAVCSSGQTLYYTILDTSINTVSVTHPGISYAGYTMPTGTLNIPSSVSYNGITYCVVSVSSSAFLSCTELTSVNLPTSIQEIGDNAFSGCTGISNIILPNSIVSIGNNAFSGCTALTTVDFPSSLTTIGSNAFYNCHISTLTLPNTVLFMSSNSFANTPWYNQQSSGLVYAGKVLYCYKGSLPNNATLVINSDVRAIAEGALSGETNINRVTLPSTLQVIGGNAFNGCSNMKITSFPDSLYNVGDYAFYNCDSLHLIPQSLKHIGSYAFQHCEGIVQITIPEQTEYIGYSAFSNMGNLTTVYYNAINCHCPSYYYNNLSVFGNSGNFTTLQIGLSVQRIPDGIFSGCVYLTGTLNIPSSVTYIGQGAFSNCSNLMGTLTIPAMVNTIGASAFNGCTGFTSLVFNAINCTTAARPFYTCSNITSLSIGNGVQRLPDYLFYECNHFVGSLHIPQTVRKIGSNTFYNCSGFTGTLSIPEHVDSIGMNAFGGCTGFSAIEYNAIDLHISGSSPFVGCSNVTSIQIGNSVINIPPNVFNYQNSNLSGSIVIPNSVIKVGNMAFNIINSSITTITIGENVDSLGSYCFGATYNTNIPLTTINYNAKRAHVISNNYIFYGCNNITSFNIGSNVIDIPEGLIVICPNLHQVNLPEGLRYIGANNFSGCGLNGNIVIPASLQSIGGNAFSRCYYLDTIFCNAITPPVCEQLQSYLPFNEITDKPLIVPCESRDDYRSALGWSRFSNIDGIGCQNGIQESSYNPVSIYAINQNIIIRSNDRCYVNVYSIVGDLITMIYKETEQVTIPVLGSGVYIVKVGECPARKVVVVK